jgi:glycosyltransferase involved in cell wall biosynthesis
LFLPIYKLYFKKVDKVQAISNFLAEWAEKLGVKKEKIVGVPNGADLDRFTNIKNANSKGLRSRKKLIIDEIKKRLINATPEIQDKVETFFQRKRRDKK